MLVPGTPVWIYVRIGGHGGDLRGTEGTRKRSAGGGREGGIKGEEEREPGGGREEG